MWMNSEMAKRFDPLFPESGGLIYLAEVRKRWARQLENTSEKAGDTSFHPAEVDHINKVLRLLGDDEEAKATIMRKLAFAQMKNDCAG